MKQIKPIKIWVAGQIKSAQLLNAYCVNLTLGSSATFYYSLSVMNEDKSAGETLAQGNLTMDGADYQSWTTDDVAWDWIAAKLNVEIIAA